MAYSRTVPVRIILAKARGATGTKRLRDRSTDRDIPARLFESNHNERARTRDKLHSEWPIIDRRPPSGSPSPEPFLVGPLLLLDHLVLVLVHNETDEQVDAPAQLDGRARFE